MILCPCLNQGKEDKVQNVSVESRLPRNSVLVITLFLVMLVGAYYGFHTDQNSFGWVNIGGLVYGGLLEFLRLKPSQQD